jgi:hypothetical protein
MCDATGKITHESRRYHRMIELIPVLLGVLLIAIVAASIEYYGQIRKAQKEYEKAKGAVEDIVLSFNRELRRETERLEIIAFKVEGSSAKADTALRKVEGVEKETSPLGSQIQTLNQTISQNSSNVLSEVNGLQTKIKLIETTQETLSTKLSSFDEQLQKLSTLPETKGEQTLPVMPIKRDRAMAALTDTEISVLEMLSTEGPKTAPEIKEKVQLSREHTARLMKKLYEGGYLERETGKIPFRYSVKKEMANLLRKTEPTQT